MPAMSTGVRYSISKKEKNSVNIAVEALIKCNYPMIEKEILAVIRGIEKFLIFLVPRPFLIRTSCKGILNFVKIFFIKYASVRATPMLAIMD